MLSNKIILEKKLNPSAGVFHINTDIFKKENKADVLIASIFDIVFIDYRKNKLMTKEALLEKYDNNIPLVNYILEAVRKIKKDRKLYLEIQEDIRSLIAKSKKHLQKFCMETIMDLSLEQNGSFVYDINNDFSLEDYYEKKEEYYNMLSLQPIVNFITPHNSFGVDVENYNINIGDKKFDRIYIARFRKNLTTKNEEHTLVFILKSKDDEEVFIGLLFREDLSIKENIDNLYLDDEIKEGITNALIIFLYRLAIYKKEEKRMKQKTDFMIKIDEQEVTRVFRNGNMVSATTMGVNEALHSIWTLEGKESGHWYSVDENLNVFVEILSPK